MLGNSRYFYHVNENGLVRNDTASGTWETYGKSINSALAAYGFGPYSRGYVEKRYDRGETIPDFNNYYRI